MDTKVGSIVPSEMFPAAYSGTVCPEPPKSIQVESGQSAAPRERAQMAILMAARFHGIRSTHCAREGAWLERIAEILGLAGHLPIEEFHDAHGVRRPPVIS